MLDSKTFFAELGSFSAQTVCFEAEFRFTLRTLIKLPGENNTESPPSFLWRNTTRCDVIEVIYEKTCSFITPHCSIELELRELNNFFNIFLKLCSLSLCLDIKKP